MTVKSLGGAALAALVLSAGLSLAAHTGQLPTSLAGQAVDEAVASAATDGTLADLARALAVNRIPAGFVLEGDDHRPSRVTRNERVGRMRPLGEALSGLASRRPDVNLSDSGGALFVAREGSACVPPLHKVVRDLRIENSRVVDAIQVLSRPPHNQALLVPVGIAFSRAGSPGTGDSGSRPSVSPLSLLPVTATVTLIYSEITLLDALQQVALQAPGVVWAVIELQEPTRCQINLYHPDGLLVAGGDLFSGG